MANRLVIENLISLARKHLKLLERYLEYTKEEIVNDDTVRGAVERYLYLVAQVCIDLAEAIIAYKKLRKPSTYNEAFYVLDEADIISKPLTEKLVKMTGFRNIIAHDYVKVDYDIVYDVLQKRLVDIEEFLTVIERKIFSVA